MAILMLILSALSFAAMFAVATISGRVAKYVPGQSTYLAIRIPAGATYDINFHYGPKYTGGWWNGGAGPSTAKYGDQYWMECYSSSGCTEWWSGTVPATDFDLIVVPLTTTTNSGTWTNAVQIYGTVNGQPVEKHLTVTTLLPVMSK